MSAVTLRFRRKGYAVGDDRRANVAIDDDDTAARQLDGLLRGAIEADGRNPNDDAHLWDVRVWADNGDHLFDHGTRR